MRIGVLGTGDVGKTIASKLASLGHEVMMGARAKDNASASGWAQGIGKSASHGTFAEAAAFGEIVFNCTAGAHSLDALGAAGRDNLSGKILVDVANPLDFSKGMPPTLGVCNTDSLAEQIQRQFPAARVVKALNTVSAKIMASPGLVPGTDLFICGNDPAAKAKVAGVLKSFGWESVMDLGDVTASRGMEMVLPFWLLVYSKLGTPVFNYRIVKG